MTALKNYLLKIYLFLAVLSPCCCKGFYLEQAGATLIAEHRLLIGLVSLVENWLYGGLQ